jgi:hypothetical protein
VNSIHVDLTRGDVRLVPQVALVDVDGQSEPQPGLKNLPDIAAQNPNVIAGINGGYFWRIDVEGYWRDNVCRGKHRVDAEQPASTDCPNCGVGDGVVIIDGVLESSNCNCTGYSKPSVISLAQGGSSITVLDRGGFVDPNLVPNAIAAGPNLVSYDPSAGCAFVDIPEGDDNVNRVVYEASTAVGLVQLQTNGSMVATEGVLVTTDGSDSCHPNEHYCGLQCRDLATLMKDVFGCTQAMSMDQVRYVDMRTAFRGELSRFHFNF